MLTRHNFLYRVIPAVALLFSCPGLFAQNAAPASATPPAAPANLLANLKPTHPRLLWTKEAQAETLRTHGNKPLWQDLQKVILAQADDAIEQAPSIHDIPDGRRLLGQSRAALRRILLTAYAWRITGAEKYRARTLLEMRTVCAFPNWNPSHFLDVAEMSLAVSIGYDWLYETLTPQDRAHFSTSLKKLALLPGLRSYENKSFWVTCDHNWNQVCNAGLVAAAFATAEDSPALANDIFLRALSSLPRAMRQYNPDGGYQEGPGYWEYGTTFNVVFIELLRSALDTDKGLLSDYPGFLKTAAYFRQLRGTSGQYFNYADSGTQVQPSPAFAYLSRLSPYAPEELMDDSRTELEKFIRQNLKKLQSTDRFFPMFSIWFADANPANLKGKFSPLPTHFRGHADVAVLRAPKSAADSFVGIKTGHNQTNHGHLDQGSFIFDAYGIRWVEDLGGDNYNLPGYWGMSGPRWQIFRLNNRSHNTLTPDNVLQNYNAVGFIRSASQQSAIAMLDNVYPRKFNSWHRSFTLGAGDGALKVQDDLTLKDSGTLLEWKIFTLTKTTVSPDGRSATLAHNGKSVRLSIREPENFIFKIKSADPGIKGQQPNTDFVQLVAEGSLNGTSGTVVVVLEPL